MPLCGPGTSRDLFGALATLTAKMLANSSVWSRCSSWRLRSSSGRLNRFPFRYGHSTRSIWRASFFCARRGTRCDLQLMMIASPLPPRRSAFLSGSTEHPPRSPGTLHSRGIAEALKVWKVARARFPDGLPNAQGCEGCAVVLALITSPTVAREILSLPTASRPLPRPRPQTTGPPQLALL